MQKLLKRLAKIFSAASLLSLSSCGDMPPLVTITQLDTKNNKANPFKVTKYNTKKCVLEIEAQESHDLLDQRLHGAFCLSAEDFAKYKAHFQSECKNRNAKSTIKENQNENLP